MARTKKEAALTLEERLQAALVPDWEWPYKLPENWCWTYFKSISTIQTGKKDANYGSDEGKYPFFTCAAEPIRCHGYSFDCRAILLAGNGDINNISRYNGKFEAYQRTYVVKIVEPLCFDYIFYWFKYRWFNFNKGKMFGTAIPYIRLGNLQEFPTPIPPLAEQQRIVDRIEILFAKLDEAKEKAQAVVDSFETRKAAILHKAFTGELTAKWREEHGVGVERWEHHQFSDLCAIVRGGSPRPAGDPRYYDGNIPFMKVADITRNDSPYVSKVEYSIKEEGLKKTRMVEANTLLLTNSGATLGVPAITTIRTTFNDGIAAFIGLDIDSLLFYYYFWTSKTAFLRSINMGAAQPNLNTKLIGEVEIDVPQTAERVEIARVLNALLSKEQQAKEAAEAVLDQSDLMKKSILARAFRGELGTNDPSEESAVELLKKVSHMPAETKSKAKRKFVPPKIEAQIKTDLERKIIMAFIQNDTVIMPIQQLMSVSSRKFDVIETLRNLQERGILLKENDTYKLMG